MTEEPLFHSPSSRDRDATGLRWTRHNPPRPYIFDPTVGKEVQYTRCTSFIDCLDDRSNLEKWKQRIVAVGLNTRPDLLDKLRNTDPDNRSALNVIVDAAFEAGDGFVRAEKGTELHAIAESINQSDREQPTLSTLNTADAADMAAYRQALSDYRITILDTEQRIVVDSLRVTGTYDARVLVGDDPIPRTFDLKTGGSMNWGRGKMAMQLAVYARGERYDPQTQQRSPHEVSREKGIICHLPQGSGECTMYEADLIAGWEGVLLADRVRTWRKISPDLLYPMEREALWLAP